MKQVRVRPVGGLKIRFPERPAQFLRSDGDLVNLDEFWRRRIADGDVELVTAEPRARPATVRKARAAPPPAPATDND